MTEKKRQRIIFHASEKNGYVCNTHLVELSIEAETGEEAVAKLSFVLQKLLDAVPPKFEHVPGPPSIVDVITNDIREPASVTGGFITEPEVDMGPTFGGKDE